MFHGRLFNLMFSVVGVFVCGSMHTLYLLALYLSYSSWDSVCDSYLKQWLLTRFQMICGCLCSKWHIHSCPVNTRFHQFSASKDCYRWLEKCVCVCVCVCGGSSPSLHTQRDSPAKHTLGKIFLVESRRLLSEPSGPPDAVIGRIGPLTVPLRLWRSP